jgi:CDP-paratose 2-epimerase
MRWVITGGAGFIGANATKRLLDQGHTVSVFDNLSRPGSVMNLEWLGRASNFDFVRGDVRDYGAISDCLDEKRPDVVLHLAAQVAVTTSVANPRDDFEINALGTFNVCEAVRLKSPETILLNASTNKVYGELSGSELREGAARYDLLQPRLGFAENQNLDFHSPYGCSKGTADQYVRDYSRIYGLRTVNFRQSCIYGERQFGVEDQGWVAWFVIAAVRGLPVTVYGDGKQVRDLLFVDDLVDGYVAAVEHIDKASGQSFNIGGGPKNTLSLLELIKILRGGVAPGLEVRHAPWRPGDQKLYVSDITSAGKVLGWIPKIVVKVGVSRLIAWVSKNQTLFEHDHLGLAR